MNQPVASRPCWVHSLYRVISAVEGRSSGQGGECSGSLAVGVGMQVGLIENQRSEQRRGKSEAVCEWMSGGMSRWREQPKQGPEGTFSGCHIAQRPGVSRAE